MPTSGTASHATSLCGSRGPSGNAGCGHLWGSERVSDGTIQNCLITLRLFLGNDLSGFKCDFQIMWREGVVMCDTGEHPCPFGWPGPPPITPMWPQILTLPLWVAWPPSYDPCVTPDTDLALVGGLAPIL